MSESDPGVPADEVRSAGAPDRHGGSGRLSRRGFLGTTGAAGLGAIAGMPWATRAAAVGLLGTQRPPASPAAAPGGLPGPLRAPTPGPGGAVAFHGTNQAGIATPQQDHLVFAAFDAVTTSASSLREVLATWTSAAAAMAAGNPVPGNSTSASVAPADTGEAGGLPAANLTLTFGVGPSLFDARFGLASRRPAALVGIPAFPGDQLVGAISNGDLCVQACADDPKVAFHAVHELTRLGAGVVALRWLQTGFDATVSDGPVGTPRNLMGFKDGTANIRPTDTAAMEEFVWVGEGTDQPWMVGGSYLVTRRIRILLGAWDASTLGVQQETIGRVKASGAPLGEAGELDPIDFNATNPDGSLVIPADAHIRVASAGANGGQRILRRGYNFSDGVDPASGLPDAGLFFICFQQDPRRQFIPIQQKLSGVDALSGFIVHTSSAVFACPGGVASGGRWGEGIWG